MNIGQTVTWTSGALGSEKTKTGKVLAIVRSGQSVMALIPESAKKSHIKTSTDKSKFDRVLVEVYAGRYGGIKHYYTPKLSMFDR